MRSSLPSPIRRARIPVGLAVALALSAAPAAVAQSLPQVEVPKLQGGGQGGGDPVQDLVNEVSEPVQKLLQSAPPVPTTQPSQPPSGGGQTQDSGSGASGSSPSSSGGGGRQAGSGAGSPSSSTPAGRADGGSAAGAAAGDRSRRSASGGSSGTRSGRGERSARRPAAEEAEPVAPAGDGRSGITGAIREVVEVVPGPLKVLLGLLGALVLLLGGGYALLRRRARVLERQRGQLLEEVGLLQQALLPEVPAELGGAAASVAYRPADGPAAGGDFYDAFELGPRRMAVIVGDVSGHGRQALARTTLLRFTLRAYLDAGLEPRAALQVAGRTLESELVGEFATVVLAVLDSEAGTLTYASAGHPAPVVLGPGAHDPVTAASSPPLGVSSTTGMRQTVVPLPRGALACFYTDGLTEARMRDGAVLGRARLEGIVEGLPADDVARALLERVREAADRTPDDMATCVLRPSAPPVASATRLEELEVEPSELPDTGQSFLVACGVDEADAEAAVASARRLAAEHGRALLRVTVSAAGAGVDVLPVSPESLEQVVVAPPALS
jgi:Stage II sporulation protein E (SpoIIE)